MQPETRYAKSGDVHIAYQVTGDGPLNLVVVPGWISHLDLDWDDPRKAPFLERLARFSRLIRFDKRGTGLSDPVSGVATLEQRMDDVRAVMDAVGAERAALFGFSEGGQMSILFAASYPDRAQALVLFGTHARATSGAAYPWGFPDVLARQQDAIDHWGEGQFAAVMNPGQALDPRRVEQTARWERASASPSMARALFEAIQQTDVRAVLPIIRVPTLVLHRRDDPIPVGGGRYIASQIPGARFVELDGRNHGPWMGDAEAVLGEIETFLTGTRQDYEPDRILATVLFTDIVGSTERASQLGDRRWRELLEDHDRLVRDYLERARGRAVKHTGDR
jgi:pimeloyl-ACP methyl ester carboxylesterase